MTSRKLLTVFLILLLFLPLVRLVNAGGPEERLSGDPWEEVKRSGSPTGERSKFILPEKVDPFFVVVLSPYSLNLFILVVEKSSTEEVKKDWSDRAGSLPRKK